MGGVFHYPSGLGKVVDNCDHIQRAEYQGILCEKCREELRMAVCTKCGGSGEDPETQEGCGCNHKICDRCNGSGEEPQ